MSDIPAPINPADIVPVAEQAIKDIKPGSPLSTVVLGAIAVASVVGITICAVTGHGEPAALIGIGSLATGVLIPTPGGAK